jgi:hypothetical protein
MRASRTKPEKTMRVLREACEVRVIRDDGEGEDGEMRLMEDRPWPSRFFIEIMASWAVVVGRGKLSKPTMLCWGCVEVFWRGSPNVEKGAEGRCGGVCAPLGRSAQMADDER